MNAGWTLDERKSATVEAAAGPFCFRDLPGRRSASRGERGHYFIRKRYSVHIYVLIVPPQNGFVKCRILQRSPANASPSSPSPLRGSSQKRKQRDVEERKKGADGAMALWAMNPRSHGAVLRIFRGYGGSFISHLSSFILHPDWVIDEDVIWRTEAGVLHREFK